MLLALKYIQRAIHTNPSELLLFYDLALIKQQYSQVLNESQAEKRPLDKLLNAVKFLETSQR